MWINQDLLPHIVDFAVRFAFISAIDNRQFSSRYPLWILMDSLNGPPVHDEDYRTYLRVNLINFFCFNTFWSSRWYILAGEVFLHLTIYKKNTKYTTKYTDMSSNAGCTTTYRKLFRFFILRVHERCWGLQTIQMMASFILCLIFSLWTVLCKIGKCCC